MKKSMTTNKQYNEYIKNRPMKKVFNKYNDQ